MKAEELFLAIGEVESSRLTRSELTAARPSGQREQEEPKMKKRNVSRILRNLLVAALIVSALAVTAYAVAVTGYSSLSITEWLRQPPGHDIRSVRRQNGL